MIPNINAPAASTPAPPTHPAVFGLGIVALAVAAAASGMMAYQHISGFAMPGCGPGSPCAALAASKWGKVPGLDWPVSYLGLAWFSGMLAMWIGSRGELPRLGRMAAGLGALGSAAFIGIMLGMGHNSLCPFCLATHLANFAFVAMIGLAAMPAPGRAAAPLRAPAAALATFVAVTALVGIADTQANTKANQKAEKERTGSVAEILSGANQNPPPPAPTSPATTAAPTPPAHVQTTPPPAATGAAGTPPPDRIPVAPALFTGRYVMGPQKAPVRIVMWTDYQCPDCRLLEAQVATLLTRYPSDVSVAIKHFPFCIDCNPALPPEANLHPNACWAARAAEAAGMLYGVEGFKKMHFWLFNRGGGFTAEELNAGLAQLGFDAGQLIATMTGADTLGRVQADIDEANAYGLYTTPFIYVNGGELKGWRSPNALIQTVEDVLKARPVAQGPEADRPMKAGDKFVREYWDQKERGKAWPEPKVRRTVVAPQPPPTVRVTIFGDFMEPNCVAADKIVRDFVVGRADVLYEFRYMPFERACNPAIPPNREFKFHNGCKAARAAEAAAQLGGLDAYWRTHEWLTTNQRTLSASPGALTDDALRAHAGRLGLNPEQFLQKMNSPEVTESVVNWDVSIGSRLGVQEIPRIFIEGTLVPRWKTPGGYVLERIIEEVAQKKTAPAAPPPPLPAQQGVPLIPGINAPIGGQ